MKIAVLVKAVPDVRNARLIIEGKGINLSDLSFVINEQDSYALEEAVRLKEKFGGEVAVISLGDDARRKGMTQVIRECYAKGADKGIMLIDAKYSERGPAFKSSVFASVIRELGSSVVLAGSQSSDTSTAAVVPMLAERLSYSHASLITSLSAANDSEFVVTRDLERGIQEEMAVHAPCVLSTQTGINTPRYAALSRVIMAAKKEIEVREVHEEVGHDAELLELRLPKESSRDTVFIQGTPETEAATLLSMLRERGVIQR